MHRKGSEWRRWDLHVHTPDTVLANEYGGWDEYLTTVEANPDVKVLGVTDYMSITNYSKLKKYKEAGRVKNISLLIPNIEFRLAPPTDKATAVNIHILIRPDDPNHEQEILDALGRLDWEYNRKRYSCVPSQLMALGRAFDSNATSDTAALEVGTLQFKVDFTRFRDWYQSEHWLASNSLIAVAAGADGVSGFRKDGAWAALRDEITRFSQIIFSGRPAERDFWVGARSDLDQKTMKSLGGPKPCVHGSDAHELSSLFKPDGDRFCWVKADPNFDGLTQILYEPADRVFIGPTPPMNHDMARVLTQVTISNSNGWFKDVTIPLNAGLISIIGQKGSGKSALAELIAFASGSWEETEAGSFLKRAGKHLHGTKIKLEWADDTEIEVALGEEQPDLREARYLSQRFVERLCADDEIGGELIGEIEAVIFAHTDPTDTLNASSFAELRALRTEGIRSEGDRLRENVATLIREECVLRIAASKLNEKKDRIKALKKEADGLAKQMPAAATPEEAKTEAELQLKRNALAVSQQAIAAEKQRIQKLKDVRTRIASFKSAITQFNTEIAETLRQAGMSTADISQFRVGFAGDTEAPLTRTVAAIEKKVKDLQGTEDAPADGTVRALEAQITALLGRQTADKARHDKIKQIQTRTSTINTEVKRIEAEIAKIEGPDRKRITDARSEMLAAYVAYFENLKLEQDVLEELYGPVKKRLTSDSAAAPEQSLEFSIRWETKLAKWIERGSALFDQRKTIPYQTLQGLSKKAEDLLVPAWTSGDALKVRQAHDGFLDAFRDPKFPPGNYLRSGATLEDLLSWLYEIDHIKLSYGLKYNGTELEKLSPGTKGIVLLILYLGIDVSDTRPLIVDQPDENLDNESIYSLLTAYFKVAKSRRQIILITHNPNLVVNGDSEQVIVATAERGEGGFPSISYRSGALEHSRADGTGIREHVCRILEGGSDAFRKREKRYAIGN